jgi:hypothetical protein
MKRHSIFLLTTVSLSFALFLTTDVVRQARQARLREEARARIVRERYETILHLADIRGPHRARATIEEAYLLSRALRCGATDPDEALAWDELYRALEAEYHRRAP